MAIKEANLESFVGKWMPFQTTMWSKINQTQKLLEKFKIKEQNEVNRETDLLQKGKRPRYGGGGSQKRGMG